MKKFIAKLEKKMAKLSKKGSKSMVGPAPDPAPTATMPAPVAVVEMEEPIVEENAAVPSGSPGVLAPVREETKPEPTPIVAAPLANYTYTFRRVEAADATVQVAGTFSNWEPMALTFDAESSSFKHEIELAAGQSYEYKFIINGSWICDHELPTVENEGNMNNVIEL